MNDLSQASNLFDFIMYADDTTLSSNLNKLSNNEHDQDLNTAINNELTKINDWLKINKLSLNVNKSKYMIFEKSNKNIQPLDLEISLVPIERVYNFNLLGLLIDNQLNWKKHSEKIENICSQKNGIFNKLKRILPMRVKTLLYNSLILPHLNYNIMAWGFNTHRIMTLQKKTLRIITLSKYNAHAEPLFKQLNLLKMEDILILQQLKFYFKYVHNKLPTYFQQWNLIHNVDVHSQIATYRVNREFAKKCIRYNLPFIINNTINSVKDKLLTHSLKGFANYAKYTFIHAYEESCSIVNCYICA